MDDANVSLTSFPYLLSQNPYTAPGFVSSSGKLHLCPLPDSTSSLPGLSSPASLSVTQINSKLPKSPIGSFSLSHPAPPTRSPAPCATLSLWLTFLRRRWRRRPNPAAQRQDSRAAGSGLSFPEPHCLVGPWLVPPAWAGFPDSSAPPPSSGTEAERVRGRPWRRTSRSGCTRNSLRWFR